MMAPRPLCVLQMLPELQSGGVERGTLEVSRALVQAGHRSLVMSAGGQMVDRLEREGGGHVPRAVGRKSLLTLRHVNWLRGFLREQAVDLIDVRSRMPAWLAWLAWRGMPAGHRPRLVSTVHGLYSVNAYSAVMTRGERVVAVSETVRAYLLAHYPALPPKRVVVIPRGVDAAEFPAGHRPPERWLAAWRAEYPHLTGRRLLLLPGRITRLKGHERFIDLVERLRSEGLDIHGLIVGGARPDKRAYLESLHQRVERAGLARDITFTGQRQDLREIMAISHLVLSLSSQPESFGRTVLEALSLGVPVLGYDHGGVGEVLHGMYPQGAHALPREGEAAAGPALAALASKARALLAAPAPSAPCRYTLTGMLQDTLATYSSLVRG